MTEQSVPFNTDVTAVPNGPDGKTWVRFTFGSGPLAQSVTVPEPVAQQVIQLFASKGTVVCAAVRRANLGLLTVNPKDLPKLPPLNGSKS